MNGGRATRAIATVSLRRPSAYIDAVTFVAIVTALALPRYAPVAYVIAVAWAAGATVGRARARELSNLRYFAAPLYGRELARAHALVAFVRFACTAALAAAFFAGLAPLVGDGFVAGDWYLLASMTLAQIVTSLVAMSGALREGRDRSLYIALALAAGLTIDGIGSPGNAAALLRASVIATALGFAALRAFGETLARYDPID